MTATHGTAVYYDGVSARRRSVAVTLADEELFLAENDAVIARWRYADIRRQDAPSGIFRIASTAALELARLDIADEALAADIERRTGPLAVRAEINRRTNLKIVAWSLAAAGSLIATAVYIVPLVADRLAPMVPVAIEYRLGESVDNQVRAIIGQKTCASLEGSAALATLTRKMAAKVSLPMPVEVAVLQSPVPNAFALPGGRIYLLSALLDRAKSPDEVAGVLAHEMGHVAHRDGLRVLIQRGGTSFLLGLLFGDVAGAGVVVFVGRTLVDSAYSRDAERAADDFAGDILVAVGRSPRTLGVFLTRLSKDHGGQNGALGLLQSHPLSEERLAALSKREPAIPGEPLLTEAQWQALRSICKAS